MAIYPERKKGEEKPSIPQQVLFIGDEQMHQFFRDMFNYCFPKKAEVQTPSSLSIALSLLRNKKWDLIILEHQIKSPPGSVGYTYRREDYNFIPKEEYLFGELRNNDIFIVNRQTPVVGLGDWQHGGSRPEVFHHTPIRDLEKFLADIESALTRNEKGDSEQV